MAIDIQFAQCRHCGRNISLKDGKISRHDWVEPAPGREGRLGLAWRQIENPCKGTGQPPEGVELTKIGWAPRSEVESGTLSRAPRHAHETASEAHICSGCRNEVLVEYLPSTLAVIKSLTR